MNEATINVKEVEAFCQAIFEDGNVSLRCVAESKALLAQVNEKNKVFKLTPDKGPLEARLRQAGVFNTKGYAVFYLPQKFKSGSKERYEDLVEYRAVVIDIDENGKEGLKKVQEFEIPPTCIVETSPNKYQIIWVFDKPVAAESLNADEFNEFAAALGSLFNADLQVAKGTQPFRCPGFLHQKGDTYESKLIEHSGNRVSYASLKYVTQQRYSSVGAGNGNGHAQATLEEAEKGGVSVKKFSRHSTALSWGRSLLNRGLTPGQALKELQILAVKCFEEPYLFGEGGEREGELREIIKDCVEYKKQDDAKATQLLTEHTKRNSGFVYDYSIGSMQHNRYTETAVADRVLQRFRDDLARIRDDSGATFRVYCFFGHKKLWMPQTPSTCPEIISRVKACVYDMITEPGFETEMCSSVKTLRGGGKELRPDKSKRHALEAQFLKSTTLSNIARAVCNSNAIPDFKQGQFDAQPYVLYAGNGVLDLEKSTLRDAKNEDRLLCRCEVCWNEAAKCEGWLQFLGEVFAENEEPEEMVRFMQELFGYSLSGLINEQKIFCYLGDGSNGKSKTLDALKKISGGYCTIVEPEDLTLSTNRFQKSFERIGAKVEAKRVAVLDDFQMAGSWNEAFLKMLTGPEIRARAEYQLSRITPNRAKFHIGMNKAPDPEEENFGILRRLCFIPFPRRFKENPIKSRQIDEMIEREASGILTWAQKGFLRVLERGILYPEETKNALEAYRHETFKVETAVEVLFEASENEKECEWLPLSILLEHVNSYFRSQNVNAYVTPEKLSRALKIFGFAHARKYNAGLQNTTSHFRVKLKKQEIQGSLEVL